MAAPTPGTKASNNAPELMPIIFRHRPWKIKEHDEILRRLLAQRAHEWQNLRGIRRMICHIKIEIWAWRETARELRHLDKNSPCNLYDRIR